MVELQKKVFWKSALKASILLWFLTSIIFTVFIYLNFSSFVGELLPALRSGGITREGIESAQPVILFITFLCVFSWVGFAYIYDKIPLKWGLLKVFAFNAIISAIEFFLIQSQPIIIAVIRPFYETFTNPPFVIGYLVVWSVAYWRLFEYYKKQEENYLGETVSKPALLQNMIIAYIIDEVFLWLVSAAIVVLSIIALFGKGIILGQWTGENALLAVSMTAIPVVLAVFFFRFLIGCFYWTILEARFGASIGKRLMKIQVVRENGEKIGFQDAFFRNAPKFISGLDTFLILEFLFIIQSKKQQRLFDRVAQTVVVSSDQK